MSKQKDKNEKFPLNWMYFILPAVAIAISLAMILITGEVNFYQKIPSKIKKVYRQKIVDKKYYCENNDGCVDGSYCEKIDDGCVSAEWWKKNVGNKYDCLSDSSLCKCVSNRCEKK